MYVYGRTVKLLHLMIVLLIILAETMCVMDSYAGDSMNHQKDNMPKTLVIIGASYARGLSLKELAGYQVVNKGVNGQQSFEMLARFETDVVALKPDAVLIWGFINDIFRGDPDKIEETLARTKDSFATMVELARKAGIVPILATEVTIREKEGWKEGLSAFVGRALGKESYQDSVNRHVRTINAWIKEKAAKEGILLVDIHAALSDVRGERVKEYAKPDGSHISEEGYRVLTQFLEERLKQRLAPH